MSLDAPRNLSGVLEIQGCRGLGGLRGRVHGLMGRGLRRPPARLCQVVRLPRTPCSASGGGSSEGRPQCGTEAAREPAFRGLRHLFITFPAFRWLSRPTYERMALRLSEREETMRRAVVGAMLSLFAWTGLGSAQSFLADQFQVVEPGLSAAVFRDYGPGGCNMNILPRQDSFSCWASGQSPISGGATDSLGGFGTLSGRSATGLPACGP